MWKLSLVQASETDLPQEGLMPSLKCESWMRLRGAVDGGWSLGAHGVDFWRSVEGAGLKDEDGAVGGGGESGIETADADRACGMLKTGGSKVAGALAMNVQADEAGVAAGNFADVDGVVAVPGDPLGGSGTVGCEVDVVAHQQKGRSRRRHR